MLALNENGWLAVQLTRFIFFWKPECILRTCNKRFLWKWHGQFLSCQHWHKHIHKTPVNTLNYIHNYTVSSIVTNMQGSLFYLSPGFIRDCNNIRRVTINVPQHNTFRTCLMHRWLYDRNSTNDNAYNKHCFCEHTFKAALQNKKHMWRQYVHRTVLQRYDIVSNFRRQKLFSYDVRNVKSILKFAVLYVYNYSHN